jgi:hypothetical protein
MSSQIKVVLIAVVILIVGGSYVFMDSSKTSPSTPAAPPVDPNSPPQIVKMEPPNGATDVDPALAEIRVTFNMPMGGGFSWCGGGENYPTIPEGKRPFWKEDQKTCVLPVQLRSGWNYKLGINCPSAQNFRSAAGVAAPVTWYGFSTRS